MNQFANAGVVGLTTRRGILIALASKIAAGNSATKTLSLVRAMEDREGLKVFTRYDGYAQTTFEPAVSPDGLAVCWSGRNVLGPQDGPTLFVESLIGGPRPIKLDGQATARRMAISSGARVIVARILQNGQRLLMIELEPDLTVHDLTSSVTQLGLSNLFDISISGQGSLVALGTFPMERVQLIEVPNGRTIYTGRGLFPKLSPDGNCLALVRDDALYLLEASRGWAEHRIASVKRVKGVGGWSPNSRFLLASAWTTLAAFEKRQIVVDTKTGEYGVLGNINEGDYATEAAWLSIELWARLKSEGRTRR